MANRAGRLQKEAQMLHARAQEQEALRRAKKQLSGCRANALAKAVVSSRYMPRAMRRRSVQMGMLNHPMLLLTLALYCERSNRLSTLQNWQPPPSCNHRGLYNSLRRKVLTLAPLKDHQHERLQILVQQEVNPDLAVWLVQTATDPEVASKLPMPAAKLFADMNGKLYSASMKYDLAGALRLAQVLLMGAHIDLAELIARVMPALTYEGQYLNHCVGNYANACHGNRCSI